jgi:predicted ATPase
MNRILRHIELLRDTVEDWGAYPFSIPAVAKLERLELHEGVTFLIGENGSGKSTLIEAIAIKAGFNREGGSKNFSSSHRPSESMLHRHLRLARCLTVTLPGTRRALRWRRRSARAARFALRSGAGTCVPRG